MKSSTSNSSNSDNKVNTIRRDIYRNHIKRAHGGSNYFQFFRPYLKIMSRLDALFLQDLMNLYCSTNLVTKMINGKEYFLCTTEFLEKAGCVWTKQEQRPRIKSLLKSKFIHVKRIGIPPRRWVYIDYEKIENTLDNYESCHQEDLNNISNQERPTPDETYQKESSYTVSNDTEWAGSHDTVYIRKNNSRKKKKKENAPRTAKNTENTEKSPRRPSLRSGNGKGNCACKENEARPEISSNKPALDSLRSSTEKENSGNKLNNRIKENSSISRSAPDSLRSSERELPKKRKPQIDEECARWANELKKHIQANNDIVDRFNKSTWGGHFLQLRSQLGSDRVQDILDFFGRMIETGESDRLNMPTINSAKQFKERIVWISNLKRKREREIKNMLENNILPPHLRW